MFNDAIHLIFNLTRAELPSRRASAIPARPLPLGLRTQRRCSRKYGASTRAQNWCRPDQRTRYHDLDRCHRPHSLSRQSDLFTLRVHTPHNSIALNIQASPLLPQTGISQCTGGNVPYPYNADNERQRLFPRASQHAGTFVVNDRSRAKIVPKLTQDNQSSPSLQTRWNLHVAADFPVVYGTHTDGGEANHVPVRLSSSALTTNSVNETAEVPVLKFSLASAFD